MIVVRNGANGHNLRGFGELGGLLLFALAAIGLDFAEFVVRFVERALGGIAVAEHVHSFDLGGRLMVCRELRAKGVEFFGVLTGDDELLCGEPMLQGVESCDVAARLCAGARRALRILAIGPDLCFGCHVVSDQLEGL